MVNNPTKVRPLGYSAVFNEVRTPDRGIDESKLYTVTSNISVSQSCTSNGQRIASRTKEVSYMFILNIDQANYCYSDLGINNQLGQQ